MGPMGSTSRSRHVGVDFPEEMGDVVEKTVRKTTEQGKDEAKISPR